MVTRSKILSDSDRMFDGQKDEKLRVLLIGNNPIQMGSLFKDLSDYAEVRYMAETSFTVEDSLKKIQRTRPHCIVIDDSLEPKAIKDLVEAISNEEVLQDIPITLLKDSNYKSRGYNGIQDFLLKDGLSIEQFSKSIVNAIKFRKSHLSLYRSYKKGKSKVNSLLEKRQNKLTQVIERMAWWVENQKTKGLGFR